MTLKKTSLAVVSFMTVMLSVTVTAVLLHHARTPPLKPILAIVHDASQSSAQGCRQVSDIVRREWPTLAGRAAAKAFLFTTGDDKTANEPRHVELPEVPRRRAKVLEKGDDDGIRGRYLAEVQRRCEEAPVTDRSPIFLGVKRALEQVRAVRGDDVQRSMVVRSDLQETIEPSVKQALRGDRRAAARVARTLDNAGVAVLFCGYAETVGTGVDSASDSRRRRLTRGRSGPEADRLTTVWRSMFTAPDVVTFEPFCVGVPMEVTP